MIISRCPSNLSLNLKLDIRGSDLVRIYNFEKANWYSDLFQLYNVNSIEIHKFVPIFKKEEQGGGWEQHSKTFAGGVAVAVEGTVTILHFF